MRCTNLNSQLKFKLYGGGYMKGFYSQPKKKKEKVEVIWKASIHPKKKKNNNEK